MSTWITNSIRSLTKLHETGKRVRVSETGSDTKRDLPKFWKRGNANVYILKIFKYIYMFNHKA